MQKVNTSFGAYLSDVQGTDDIALPSFFTMRLTPINVGPSCLTGRVDDRVGSVVSNDCMQSSTIGDVDSGNCSARHITHKTRS